MPPPVCSVVHSEEDCWIGVQDPKKRKQIQDRLAQRLRRKKLAEERAQNGEPESQPSRGQLTKRRRPESSDRQNPAQISGFLNINNSDDLPMMAIPLNVYSALWKNGSMLGLSCGDLTPSISKECGPDIPESLHPTALQLYTVHPPWIDRFPFPKLRDNFIVMLDLIDSDEFLQDIFCGPSFILDAGATSWDPKHWHIEEKFEKKWGFLFDPNLFGTPSI